MRESGRTAAFVAAAAVAVKREGSSHFAPADVAIVRNDVANVVIDFQVTQETGASEVIW